MKQTYIAKYAGPRSNVSDLYSEVSGSNLPRNTDYFLILRSLPQSLQANTGIVPKKS